ncbi:MAG: anthranilate synthase component II [Bacteroidota bacterium]
MAKILILDNYDSFTYNLVHYVKDYGSHQVDVFRNDKITLEEVDQYDGMILSPGPGLPREAGNLMPIIENYYESKRIFGVCLGQQAIAEAFSGSLFNLSEVYHGVSARVSINEPRHYIFDGLPGSIEAGRYHSWMVNHENFPACLRIDAVDDKERIMALSHREYDVCGVQFHPESILTPMGKDILFNWLRHF